MCEKKLRTKPEQTQPRSSKNTWAQLENQTPNHHTQTITETDIIVTVVLVGIVIIVIIVLIVPPLSHRATVSL